MNVPTIRVWQAPFEQTALGFDPAADYECVWTEPFAGETIDQVWDRFQRVDAEYGPWTPAGYTGRSISIGDVVEVAGRFWTPLVVGWRELTDDETAAFEVAA